jgi:hypothetical protein
MFGMKTLKYLQSCLIQPPLFGPLRLLHDSLRTGSLMMTYKVKPLSTWLANHEEVYHHRYPNQLNARHKSRVT